MPHDRRANEQTTTPEPQPRIQGEGGIGCREGRVDPCERFFGGRAREGGTVAERKTMIDRLHGLPLVRQARELGISRGSVYYLPRPVSATDLVVGQFEIDPAN